MTATAAPAEARGESDGGASVARPSRQEDEVEPNAAPVVSVVVPVRNDAPMLRQAVESVLRQRYEGRLEVLLVVGSSTDGTSERAAEIAARDERVQVLHNRDGNTPSALNIGIAAAKGAVIARVDAHGWLDDEHYIESGVRALDRTGADAVGGVVRFVGHGAVGRAIAFAQGWRMGGGPAAFRVSRHERESDGLSWGMFRRELFDRVGLFDEQLSRNQDDEFCHRIRLGGGRMIVTPTMKFSSLARSSLRALGHQYVEWGRFRMFTIAKQGPATSRQLMPPSLVALLTLGAATDVASRGRCSAGRLGAAGYVAAVTSAASVASARAGQWKLSPLVAAAAITMHLGYGYGFWLQAARRLRANEPFERPGSLGGSRP